MFGDPGKTTFEGSGMIEACYLHTLLYFSEHGSTLESHPEVIRIGSPVTIRELSLHRILRLATVGTLFFSSKKLPHFSASPLILLANLHYWLIFNDLDDSDLLFWGNSCKPGPREPPHRLLEEERRKIIETARKVVNEFRNGGTP